MLRICKPKLHVEELSVCSVRTNVQAGCRCSSSVLKDCCPQELNQEGVNGGSDIGAADDNGGSEASGLDDYIDALNDDEDDKT